MANEYAIDFSVLGSEVQNLKSRKRKQKVDEEVNALLSKRESRLNDLDSTIGKQKQLMSDTPEMDQTANQQDLRGLNNQKVDFKTRQYDELGGLGPEDLKGLTREAVDSYKERMNVERVSARERSNLETADALVQYEAMGQDPEVLVPWFNKHQAHKWGMANGVETFKKQGQNVLVYEKGTDYSNPDNTPLVIPQEQFNQFASSSLNPEVTKKMAGMLHGANINLRVKHKQLIDAAKINGDLEGAMEALGISQAEVNNMMGFPILAEKLGEYINVVGKDGKVEGMQTGVGKGGKAFRRKGPKKVEKSTGGSGDPLKNYFKLGDFMLKAGKMRKEALDSHLNSSFGKEFFEFDEKLDAFVPQIPKIQKTLKAQIDSADTNTDEGKETVRRARKTLAMIEETDAQMYATADSAKNIAQLMNAFLQDPAGLDEDRLAGNVAVGDESILTTEGGAPKVAGIEGDPTTGPIGTGGAPSGSTVVEARGLTMPATDYDTMTEEEFDARLEALEGTI